MLASRRLLALLALLGAFASTTGSASAAKPARGTSVVGHVVGVTAHVRGLTGAHRLVTRTHLRTTRVLRAAHAGRRANTVARRAAAPTAKPPVTAPAPAPASKAAWSDSFESGNFSAWSWWGQGDASYAHRDVVGGPIVHSGTHAGRFETTPADIAAGRIHAKVYKSFGTNLDTPASHAPSDVSGTYSAWYYLPTDYKVTGDSWVNVFQFKEKYHRAGGDDQSDPLWWVQLFSAKNARSCAGAWDETVGETSRDDAPVAFLNRWGNDWKTKRAFVPVPLGRWFQITATIHQGDRIDFTLDGQSLGSADNSEYHVSPSHGKDSTEWIWGVGNYSTAANGPLYIDDASYTRP